MVAAVVVVGVGIVGWGSTGCLEEGEEEVFVVLGWMVGMVGDS